MGFMQKCAAAAVAAAASCARADTRCRYYHKGSYFMDDAQVTPPLLSSCLSLPSPPPLPPYPPLPPPPLLLPLPHSTFSGSTRQHLQPRLQRAHGSREDARRRLRPPGADAGLSPPPPPLLPLQMPLLCLHAPGDQGHTLLFDSLSLCSCGAANGEKSDKPSGRICRTKTPRSRGVCLRPLRREALASTDAAAAARRPCGRRRRLCAACCSARRVSRLRARVPAVARPLAIAFPSRH
jgi:hypothetical protein